MPSAFFTFLYNTLFLGLYLNKQACLLKLDWFLLASLGYMQQSLGDICQVIKPSTFCQKASFVLNTFCSNTICSPVFSLSKSGKKFSASMLHACVY